MRAFALAIVACGLRAPVVCAQCAPEWEVLGTFPGHNNAVIHALTKWDPDGPGPVAPQLVVGGEFTSVGGVALSRVARWDGTQWLPFGAGLNAPVRALTAWDPDGSGPEAPQLVAGGEFTASGDVPLNRIARWDGTRWLPFGSGMYGTVRALTTWDPDGPGPQFAQLVVGGEGDFAIAGGMFARGIARWDGAQWLPFGSGMVGPNGGAVYALTTWDADESGPEMDRLVAGGGFSMAGGVPANRVALWDGTGWIPLAAGPNGVNLIYALTSWDPDGAGPLAPRLVAGGTYTIAQWDGVQWLQLTAINGSLFSLLAWDPDGPGPQMPQLVGGGQGAFYTPGAPGPFAVGRWDGTGWLPFGSGPAVNAVARALISWDPDGPGPQTSQLVLGGTVPLGVVSLSGLCATYGCPSPVCPCDWNQSGTLDSQDFFDFLVAFFNGVADFNHDLATDSRDLLDFLACFFAPPGGC